MAIQESERISVAPWTEQEVHNLNTRQQRHDLHPYTCGNDHPEPRNLVATIVGWICPTQECDYRQQWAHKADTIGDLPQPLM